MSVRDRYWGLEAYLERHPVLYYGLLFLCPVAARVGYAAVGSEPIVDALRGGIVFATTFVLVTALLRSIFD